MTTLTNTNRVHTQFTVRCPDGYIWETDDPLNTQAEAQTALQQWAENCGCESTESHVVVSRVVPPWSDVPA